MDSRTDRGGEIPPGLSPLEFSREFNPKQVDEALGHIRENCKRPLPRLEAGEIRDDTLVIVGGGPSLKTHLDYLKNTDNKIICVNEAHDFLVREGIYPWGFAFLEVAPWPDALCEEYPEGCRYFIPSHAHPPAFDRLEGRDVTMWHARSDIGEVAVIPDENPLLVTCLGTPSLSCLTLGLVLGFRKFEMVGCDACCEDTTHVYTNRTDENHQFIEVWCGGRLFKTMPYLAKQAAVFTEFIQQWGWMFSLTVHGDGLLAHIHKKLKGAKHAE